MIPTEALRKMLSMGLTLEDAVELAEVWDQAATARPITANAMRQRRYRERKAAECEAVTESVTRDVTSNATDETPETKVSPTPPSKTQPPKGGIYNTTREAGSIDFETFWAAYPLKVGKANARKAYSRALRRIEGPDPPTIVLRGLDRMIPGWDDPAYTPHPTTWLNRDGWEDQPQQPKAQRPANDRPDNSAKFNRHQANLERAFAGAESAARHRAFKSESGF